MSKRFGTEDDPRSTGELLRFAVRAKTKRAFEKCIEALAFRETKHTFKAAETLCSSAKRKERIVGAHLASKLGAIGNDRWRKRAIALLLRMLSKDRDARELQTILLRIANISDGSCSLGKVRALARHRSALVRYGVARALDPGDEKASLETLLALMNDSSPRVRDIATFAVGDLCDKDSPQVRRALAERLEDRDWETYHEAVKGLAKRKDERAYEVLLEEFDRGECGSLLFEAAVELDDPRLHGPALRLLRRSRDDGDINPGWLADLEFAVDELYLTRIRQRLASIPLEMLNEVEKSYFAAALMVAKLRDANVEQYFSSEAGNYAEGVVSMLRAANPPLPDLAEALTRAMAFVSEPYSADVRVRRRQLSKPRPAAGAWARGGDPAQFDPIEQCEAAFFEHGHKVDEEIRRWAREHEERLFSDLEDEAVSALVWRDRQPASEDFAAGALKD